MITFASAASFEKGMQTLFGFPPQVARALATNNGGALIVPLRSIAVNWALLSRERPLTILRHELAHAMIREVAGASAVIPSWFDEGLATMEQSSWTLTEEDRYVAASLVGSGQTTLAKLTNANDWIEQSGRFKGRNYQVASVAVDALQRQVGVQGIARLLEQLGQGSDFESAFSTVSRTSVAAFSRAFPEAAVKGAPTKIVTTELASGEVAWTLKSATPDVKVHVTIDGRDGLTYRLAFDVTTDANGTYASTFGATAAAGTYFIQAVAGDAEVNATIRVRK